MDTFTHQICSLYFNFTIDSYGLNYLNLTWDEDQTTMMQEDLKAQDYEKIEIKLSREINNDFVIGTPCADLEGRQNYRWSVE